MELPRQQKIVFDYLSALVKNGRQQGELLPTVSSLTKTLSVSRMTVVKVLAIMESMDILYTKLGKGTFAGSRAVAEKKVMPYFHYVPVPPGKKPVITFLSPFRHNDPFMNEFTLGVESGIDLEKYELVKHHLWYGNSPEEKIIKEAAKNSSGIILITPQMQKIQDLISELVRKNYPIVLLDQWPKSLVCNSVSADNEDAIFKGMEYLYDLGHRKITFATQKKDNSSVASRINAYCLFMKKKKLSWQVVIDEKELMKIVQTSDPARRPTAVFAYCDAYASVLARKFAKAGIRVPEDISIIGFDDNPLAQKKSLQLTTLQQPKYKIGLKAALLIQEIMEEKLEQRVCRRYFIGCNLIIRESTQEPAKTISMKKKN